MYKAFHGDVHAEYVNTKSALPGGRRRLAGRFSKKRSFAVTEGILSECLFAVDSLEIFIKEYMGTFCKTSVIIDPKRLIF